MLVVEGPFENIPKTSRCYRVFVDKLYIVQTETCWIETRVFGEPLYGNNEMAPEASIQLRCVEELKIMLWII